MAITKVTSGLISADASSIDLNIDAGTLYLDVSENRVGIGTTSPSQPLTVSKAGDLYIQVNNSSAGYNTYLGTYTNESRIVCDGAKPIAFFVNGSRVVDFANGGNVGIGNSSPSAKLHITGDTGIRVNNSANTQQFDLKAQGSNLGIENFFGSGSTITLGTNANGGGVTERMRIDSSGNVGIGTSSPSRPLNVVSAYSSGTVTTSLKLATVGGYDSGSGTALEFGQDQGTYPTWVSGKISSPRTDTNYGGSLVFSTNRNSSATDVSEAMRIDSTGNVGIGETGPEYRLQVDGTNVSSGGGLANLCLVDRTPYNGTFPGAGITFRGEYTSGGSTTNFATIQGIKENTSSGNYATALRFTTRPNGSGLVERMRIDSSGNVLVNNTTGAGGTPPNSGFVLETGGNIKFRVSSNGSAASQYYNASGTIVGSVVVNASSTAYNTSSDYRLKENVDYNFNALDRVAQLKPARFNFIADADTTVDGFLAHEVQDIVPEAITGEKDAVKEEEYEITPAVLDDDGNVVTEAEIGTREVPEYQGIDQSKLVPLLTKAIQEQQTIIDDLKTRIETLENA